MSKSDQILAAHDALLALPIELRGLNPETGWLPLTVDEAWVLAVCGNYDTPYGSLMGWRMTSDCPNDEDHDPLTGECVCWDGTGGAVDHDWDKELFASHGPFEWWPTPHNDWNELQGAR